MFGSKIDIIDKKIESFGISTVPASVAEYSIGDVIGTILYFSNVCKFGQGFIILKASMLLKSADIPSGLKSLRLHLYKNAPSTINDNASFTLTSVADIANYLGYITFENILDQGNTFYSQVNDLMFTGTIGGTILYGYLEALETWTPPANLSIEIRLFGVDS